MKRRQFIAGLGSAAKAQVSAFTQALAELGWTDGRNVRIDLRWGGDDINRRGPG
jgi:hypothetical protein